MRSLSNKTLGTQNIENTLRGLNFDALPALPDEFHKVFVAVRATFNSLADTKRNLRIVVQDSGGTRLYVDTYRELSNGDSDEVNYTAVGPIFPPKSEVLKVQVSSDVADADTDLVFDLLSDDSEYYQAYSVPSAPFTADSLQQLVQTMATLTANGGDGDLAAALTLLQHGTYGLAKLMQTGADSDTGKTLSDQIDGASTHNAAAVWAVATRVLTANTNLNDLDAAAMRAAMGLASANLDTQLGDIPTVAEFNARTLVAASYFDPTSDTVANVTTVGSVTTKTGYALTSGERDSIAAAYLGLTNGIETGVTPKQALQRIGAVVAGKISGAGTGTEVAVGLDNSTDRVSATVDNAGNRSAMGYDP